MSAQRIEVDLGLMSLPIGETMDRGCTLAFVDPSAVSRFSFALGAARAVGFQMHDQEGANNCSVNGADGRSVAYIGSDEDKLGADIEYVWFSLGSDMVSRREVAFGLRREVLEQTWVRLFESGGRLHVCLYAGTDVAQAWLSARIEQLAKNLGERLKRGIRISMYSARQGGSADRSSDWPEDFH